MKLRIVCKWGSGGAMGGGLAMSRLAVLYLGDSLFFFAE